MHQWFKIYYINLDSREDRKQQFLASMSKFGLSENCLTRFPAIARSFGAHGCALSHVGVLEQHLATYPTFPCLIFEDDFVWKVDREHVEHSLAQFLEGQEWDVLLFAASIYDLKKEQGEGRICKVTCAQTTTAYLVHPRYCETLLQKFKEAERRLQTGKKRGNEIDVVWRSLQERDRWFLAYPGWGVQADGFSDIEQKQVKYKFI